MASSCQIDLLSAEPTAGRQAAKVNDNALLDVTRDCVRSVGIRRTTLTEIARKAGVSRMTVYRRFPDVSSLVAALLTREFGALLVTSSAEAAHHLLARTRLVVGAVSGASQLITDPLMTSVLDRDPELLLPYLVERIGSTQRFAERHIAEHIMAGHRDGSIRSGDVLTQTRAIFLIMQAFVVSHRPACSTVDHSALLAELGTMLEGALRPLETS